jgi:NAD(P)H-dependent flavin oxidoreductase YrpB (nitropropane dioxygenase family)
VPVTPTQQTSTLCTLLDISFPVIQDGMGPVSTTRLATAVSNAGGLGTISSLGTTGDPVAKAHMFRKELEDVRSLGCGSFAANIPLGRDANGTLLPVCAAYMDAVIEACSDSDAGTGGLKAVITSAGWVPSITDRLHDVGLVHIQKIGSVSHARKAAANGVDVLIASGSEMGGHTHSHPISTMVLAPQAVDAVEIPVVVSGGIYDARGLAAALAFGAAGVAMGTRFAASRDSDWHPAYAERLVGTGERDDIIFPGYLGPIRGLKSGGTAELARLLHMGVRDEVLSQWKEDRIAAAMVDGDVLGGLLPAGQCASAIHDIIDVGDFLPRMVRDAQALLSRAQGILTS